MKLFMETVIIGPKDIANELRNLESLYYKYMYMYIIVCSVQTATTRKLGLSPDTLKTD